MNDEQTLKIWQKKTLRYLSKKLRLSEDALRTHFIETGLAFHLAAMQPEKLPEALAILANDDQASQIGRELVLLWKAGAR